MSGEFQRRFLAAGLIGGGLATIAWTLFLVWMVWQLFWWAVG